MKLYDYSMVPAPEMQPSAGARRWPSRVAAPLLLLIICCGFHWKLILTGQYTWVDGPDMVHQEVPRFQFQMKTWHAGAFPLWDPHLWCGQPFLGQVVGAANPVNWPFFFLRANKSGKVSLRVLNWYFVAIHFLGGLFAYFLCRDLDRSLAASLTGALVFALCGFFVASTWIGIMGGFLWAPLVFLFLLRTLRGYRPAASAALCGLFLGACWLGGHHEIPIYVSFAVAGIWLYQLAVSDTASRTRLFRLGVLALLVAALTSGLQTVPAYEYGHLALRWVGADHPVSWNEPIPYQVFATYSLRPGSVLGLVVPWLADDSNGYIGVTVLILAISGVIAGWKERWVRLLTTVALCGLLFSLGAYNIFHGILYAVAPLLGKARTPGRILSIFDFAVAPLTAYGLDALLAGCLPGLVRRVAFALAAVGAGLYAVALGFSTVRDYHPSEMIMFTAFVALLLAAAMLAWHRGAVSARFVTAALGGLMLAELAMGSGAFTERSSKAASTLLPKLSMYDDIADYLRKQPQPVRVDFDEQFNFGEWEGIDSLRGFGASITANIYALHWPQARPQDLLGVTYTVARAPKRPGQALVFQASSGYNVYQNPNAFPRVWAVHRAVQMKTGHQVSGAIENPGFDARDVAPMLDSPPALESCAAADEVRMTGRSAGEVTVQAKMGCRGMVVLADTWYPGWQATVDGRPAMIYQPYLALRGVVVPAGSHTVVMRYRPITVLVGAGMTLAGVLITGLLLLRRSGGGGGS